MQKQKEEIVSSSTGKKGPSAFQSPQSIWMALRKHDTYFSPLCVFPIFSPLIILTFFLLHHT
jgi:hypothetical protein